jgi:uncharacterized protein YceH (UPF0502 family)
MSPTDHVLPPLTPLEARVLGVLLEKEKTTPDAYPLTVNSLTAGCNQKTSRSPVMSVSDAEIQATLEDLRGRLLVIESYGASGRVLRYAQNFGKCYALPAASVALLSVLMLRGAQTVSELRANCERYYRFDDASSVEAYLEELAARASGALTRKLPKQPGSREHRWAHLLCGATHFTQETSTTAEPPEDLQARVEQLEHDLAELRAELVALASRIGGAN